MAVLATNTGVGYAEALGCVGLCLRTGKVAAVADDNFGFDLVKSVPYPWNLAFSPCKTKVLD